MLQASYSKIRTKDGGKFYGPAVTFLTTSRHLKKAHKTATAALQYAKRFIKKWNELHGEKKEIPSN